MFFRDTRINLLSKMLYAALTGYTSGSCSVHSAARLSAVSVCLVADLHRTEAVTETCSIHTPATVLAH